MAQEQRIIHFSGEVQGVGFRYAACRVARRHAVAGYVRNLPDGRVEVVAEGDAEEMGAFLAELRQEMGGYIQGMTQQTTPASNKYPSFTVRF